MKKLIYTLSFFAFSSIVANAQTTTVQSMPGAAEQFKSNVNEQQEPVNGSKSSESKKGTRMAINEKGVPASKQTTTATPANADKSAKPVKTATPGQPTTTSEKK